MQSNYHKFILWHARRAVDQLGLTGVAGLGLLVFCGMYYLAGLRPLQTEVKMLQRERAATQSAVLAGHQAQPVAVDQLQSFYAAFPNIDTAPDLLASVHSNALAQGLVLDQGEYNLVRKQDEKLVRYGVVLPIKGDYVQVRKFLSRILADFPNISLDGVDFQRQNINETMIEAQVRMTLFMVN